MASSMSAAASSCSDGEPGHKRRRLLDAGGPIEDDETARQKMRDARVYARGVDGTPDEFDGFDPGNVADVKNLSFRYDGSSIKPMGYDESNIKPVGYFAKKGDLPMMRWLYVNGADTRDVDVDYWFPMYAAALNGRMEVCKWLFGHGAAKDVKRRTRESSPFHPNDRSPLYVAFGTLTRRDVSRWLILNGALCKDDDSGDLDVEIMKHDLIDRSWFFQERKALLEWANDLHRARTSFLLFLSGALSAPKSATSTSQFSSPLRLMGGNPGIFETIGAYVGIHLGRDARIIRQLTEMLPKAIAEFHVDDDSSGESSYESNSGESSSDE